MNDPLAKIADEMVQHAGHEGFSVFFGLLAENDDEFTVSWNEQRGGDWKCFLSCAKSLNARVVYISWAPLERFQVDEAVSDLESQLSGREGLPGEGEEIRKRLEQVKEFNARVGLTCSVDVAFVAGGVIHTYQKSADWFEEFLNLLPEEEEEETEFDGKTSLDKNVINKWATALAGDPKYITCKGPSQRQYLLEKIAGEELSQLPIYQILDRAETVFELDYKAAAEEGITNEVLRLHDQGLNNAAIVMKLKLPRDRVSAILSVHAKKS